LWVVSLGFLSYGLLGAALALVAVTIPPFIILPLDMIYKYLEGQRWVQITLRSLTMVSVGLMISSVWSILEGRASDVWGITICLGACLACLSKRVGSLVIVVMGAVIGYLIYGLH
jgi:chromate transporter